MLPTPQTEGGVDGIRRAQGKAERDVGQRPVRARHEHAHATSTTLVIERVDPKPGERALDAATGTGAVAILAAKRGADVVGMDLAPVLIDTARERAAEEGVTSSSRSVTRRR